MLHHWVRGYRRLILLGATTLPVIAAGGCTLDQWLIPIAAGVGGYLGWQLLSGA